VDKNLHKQDRNNTFARDVMIIDTNKNINDDRQFSDDRSNDSEIVLSVEGVSKKFCRNLKRSLFYGVQDIASDLSGIRSKSNRLRPKEFWAVDDVSLQLRKGEAVGLVSKNGSGKSTLLRIIAGLIKPDLGTVAVKGRLAPLIALGAGFNPILTGRENIYANMAILGLSKKEIDERFDDVVEFAEIGEAIDAPVQTYSSGMAARLGFASAIHTEPDILLIDEVLAVGDVRFRGKCTRKLAELRQKGISFIFVSHNHDAMQIVCDQGIYLLGGRSVINGDIRSVLDRYENDLFVDRSLKSTMGILSLPEKSESESTGLDALSVFLQNSEGQKIRSLISGQTFSLIIKIKSIKDFEKVGFNVQIEALSQEGGQFIYMNSLDDRAVFDIPKGKHEISVQMPYLSLGPGTYSMRIFIRANKYYLLERIEGFQFLVEKPDNYSYSKIYQPRTWKIKNE